MSTNKKIFFLGLTVLIGAFLLWFFQKDLFFTPHRDLVDVPKIQQVINEDSDFKSGQQAMIEGKKCTEIASHFQASYNKNKGTEFEVFSQYMLALHLACSKVGNVDDPELKQAISLLKDIVSDPISPPGMKASSLQSMERLLFSSKTLNVISEITSTEPYTTFYKEKNLRLLQQRMLEYAETFYSVPGVEMKLASLYAKDLLSSEVNPTKLLNIEKLIKKGEDSRTNLEKYPVFSVEMPEVFLYRAVTAHYYYKATNKMPFGDVDTLYKSSIQSAEREFKKIPTLHYYYYAIYLAEKNTTENHDLIKDALKRVYINDTFVAKSTEVLFSNEKDNILDEKRNIVLLASIDENLKKLLLTKGWTENDFRL